MMDMIGQRRREFPYLILPVIDQGGRAYHDRLQITFVLLTVMVHHGQGWIVLPKPISSARIPPPTYIIRVIQPLAR